jgi:hypothetical protein
MVVGTNIMLKSVAEVARLQNSAEFLRIQLLHNSFETASKQSHSVRPFDYKSRRRWPTWCEALAEHPYLTRTKFQPAGKQSAASIGLLASAFRA